jgi:hypothetical protein
MLRNGEGTGRTVLARLELAIRPSYGAPISKKTAARHHVSRTVSARGHGSRHDVPQQRGRALDFDSGDLLREKAHLPLNEAAINLIMAHQVVRRPVLNDLSGVQYDNAVEISDCREAMRDRNYRAALHQSPKCLLNRFLGFAIKRGRRLIQQK